MRKILFIGAALSALFALPASATTTFDGNQVNLVGSAQVLGNGDLQLTSTGWSGGAAWLGSSLSTATSFRSTFNFSLAQSGFNGNMADGIAFVLQNQGSSALGAIGGNLGYTGLNGVGSVIQTWDNNRLGLNTNGNAYDAASFSSLNGARLVTGKETVAYNATTHELTMTGTVVIDGTSYAVNDATNINLSSKFGANMYVGITGATGGSYADQRITGFTVAAVPEADSYAMLLAGLGLLGFMARRRKPAQAV